MNFTELPFVSISQRKKVPASPGVYFVISKGKLIYIGSSGNLRQRIGPSHPVIDQISSSRALIHFLLTQDRKTALAMERDFIYSLSPSLNYKKMPDMTRAIHVSNSSHQAIKIEAAQRNVGVSVLVEVILAKWRESLRNGSKVPKGKHK